MDRLEGRSGRSDIDPRFSDLAVLRTSVDIPAFCRLIKTRRLYRGEYAGRLGRSESADISHSSNDSSLMVDICDVTSCGVDAVAEVAGESNVAINVD
jgi:hypothetical protein